MSETELLTSHSKLQPSSSQWRATPSFYSLGSKTWESPRLLPSHPTCNCQPTLLVLPPSSIHSSPPPLLPQRSESRHHPCDKICPDDKMMILHSSSSTLTPCRLLPGLKTEIRSDLSSAQRNGSPFSVRIEILRQPTLTSQPTPVTSLPSSPTAPHRRSVPAPGRHSHLRTSATAVPSTRSSPPPGTSCPYFPSSPPSVFAYWSPSQQAMLTTLPHPAPSALTRPALSSPLVAPFFFFLTLTTFQHTV